MNRFYYILSATIFIFLLSCKANKHIGSSEEEYVMAYKKAVLYGCVNRATKGNLQRFSESNNDLGIAIETAVLYHAVALEANKKGEELSKGVREINYADYDGKKPIFSDCVDFAFSRSIDSVARIKYEQLRKGKLKYE